MPLVINSLVGGDTHIKIRIPTFADKAALRNQTHTWFKNLLTQCFMYYIQCSSKVISHAFRLLLRVSGCTQSHKECITTQTPHNTV